MNALDIFIRVFSNCMLTFMPAFAPERKKLLGRFLYIFARYTVAPGRHLRGEIERQFGAELRAFLFQHGRRLRAWLERAVQELKMAFDATADIQRAKFAPVHEDGVIDRSTLEHDLALLQNWPPQAQTGEDFRGPDASDERYEVFLPKGGGKALRSMTPASPTKPIQS